MRFIIFIISIFVIGCGGGGNTIATNDIPEQINSADAIDISYKFFSSRNSSCSFYVNDYKSIVRDLKRAISFEGTISITENTNTCNIDVNKIPNHDFNDSTANFPSNVSAQRDSFVILKNPIQSEINTFISRSMWDGILLNGVVIDLLSAGGWKNGGDTPTGCANCDWILNPMGEYTFGTDLYNAHVQPDGTYHYHGDPSNNNSVIFNSSPATNSEGSPVIGFAADGFPIFGSYVWDSTINEFRKAISSYKLKSGLRGTQSSNNPGGNYNGRYDQDYEFVDGSGDLDICNGRTDAIGVYGYYVTQTYPYFMKCFKGTPHSSFNK